MVKPEQKKKIAHPHAPPLPNDDRLSGYIHLEWEFVINKIATNFNKVIKSKYFLFSIILVFL